MRKLYEIVESPGQTTEVTVTTTGWISMNLRCVQKIGHYFENCWQIRNLPGWKFGLSCSSCFVSLSFAGILGRPRSFCRNMAPFHGSQVQFQTIGLDAQISIVSLVVSLWVSWRLHGGWMVWVAAISVRCWLMHPNQSTSNGFFAYRILSISGKLGSGSVPSWFRTKVVRVTSSHGWSSASKHPHPASFSRQDPSGSNKSRHQLVLLQISWR